MLFIRVILIGVLTFPLSLKRFAMGIMRLGKTTAPLFSLAVLGVLGCRQAAGVLFDVPPPTPPAATTGPVVGSVLEDTVRPPIESVKDPDSIVALLPKSADGEIDWVQALQRGVVKPRGSPPGARRLLYLEGFGYDLVLGEQEYRFPHSAHVGWLTCETCHPTLVPRSGTHTSMDEIDNGKSCGVCHRAVAFSNEACSRCHQDMPPAKFTAALDTGFVMARAADSGAAGPYPPSRFTHGVHRIRYRCSACHNALFQMRAGADTLDMASMQKGASCGACHDGIAAFGIAECQRCHVTKRGPPS